MIESKSTSFSAIAMSCYWLFSFVDYSNGSKGEPRADGGESVRVNVQPLLVLNEMLAECLGF